MSPFELTHEGGSVEHWNAEAGLTWLQRIVTAYPATVWLNPAPERYWMHSPSVGLISRTFAGRMFPLTLNGIDQATRELMR
jgi:uncharacterized protein with von Willebrand factor type A (vWA) domain